MSRADLAARASLVALFALTLYLMYRIFVPFLTGILWSFVLVVAFNPVYTRLLRVLRGRAWLASSVLSLVVAAVVVIPCVVAVVKAGRGLTDGYAWLKETLQADTPTADLLAQHPSVQALWDRLNEWIDLESLDLRGMALSSVQAIGAYLAGRSGQWVANAASTILNFVVMLVTMAVLFHEGPGLLERLRRFLPLRESDRDAVIRELREVTRSVFVGVILTALVQGILGGIGTAIVGLPNPVAFGAAMFVCAILPGGTLLVWLPAAIWLFLAGSPWKAVVLIAWGAGVVSMADNFLRPFFIGRGVRMHALLVFFGTLGGMLAFGLIGLFIGPLIITLFLFLLEVFRRDFFAPEAEAPSPAKE